MSDPENHSSFIKTPKQLVITVLLSFLIPIIGIALLVHLVVQRPSADPSALKPESIAARIQPVGRVVIAGTPEAMKEGAAAPMVAKPAAKAAGPADGKSVYNSACVACHGAGVAGAPKTGDKAAWAARLAAGIEGMTKTAINGKGAMPPRGGNAALSDAEVRAAVEFMIGQSK